jgi:aspartate aminotransferase
LNAIDGIRCQNPKGAFYVFPNIGGACEQVGAVEAYEELPAEIRAKTSPSTLFQMFLLFTHHVATLDRKSFGQIGSEGKHFLRISIATGKEELERGLENIARAAQDRDGFQAYMSSGNPLY